MDHERPAFVEFETRAVEDRAATEDQGHVVYKDQYWVNITPMGNGNTVVERIAEEWLKDKERQNDKFLRHYQESFRAFKEGEESPVDGTRIRDWPSATPAQIKQLDRANVRTIEDLAAANETLLNAIGMGARALKQKAEAWLKSSEDVGKVAERNAKLEQTVEHQTDVIAKLEKDVAELRQMLDLKTTPKPAARKGKAA
ncbi:hypothetical protein [Thalassospira lohafexi]|uniref:Uncharacterized protein n=1 Tax=Thalassospira lohafexi TaxID=744227 RepID=A0A2N3L0T1_9PROT|nr:hypothetical protein [Thalassospira lohafexi]PKR56347.1 hypothetical protein COO92_21315 [Thalassospira lohafexi]